MKIYTNRIYTFIHYSIQSDLCGQKENRTKLLCGFPRENMKKSYVYALLTIAIIIRVCVKKMINQ